MMKIILLVTLLGFGVYLTVTSLTGRNKKSNLIIGILLIVAGISYGMDQYKSNHAQLNEETSMPVESKSGANSKPSSDSESTTDTTITNPLTKGTVVYGDGTYTYDMLNDVNAQPISDKELTDMGGSQTITAKDLFSKYGNGILVAVNRSTLESAYDYPSADHKGQGKATFIVDKDGMVQDFNLNSLDYTPAVDEDGWTIVVDDSKARLFQ